VNREGDICPHESSNPDMNRSVHPKKMDIMGKDQKKGEGGKREPRKF